MYVMQTKRRTSLNFLLFQARRRIAITAFITFLIDNVSKRLALKTLPDYPVKLMGDFLKLDLKYNSGAAFGLATSHTILLSSLAIGVAFALFYFSSKVTNLTWALALGLVLGGIIGNLSDRIFRPPGWLQGQVVDWIELPHWPTFNLADSSIVIATFLFLFLTVRNVNPKAPDKPEESGK